MENLKDFMLLFHMELNPHYHPSQEEIITMKNLWSNWIGGIAQQARLVSSYQLGFEGNTIKNNSEVKPGYLTEIKTSVSGNLVLKAIDLEEATKMAKHSPILEMGGCVEIRNVLTTFLS